MECMFWVSGASKGCRQAYDKYVENRLIGQRVTLAVWRCIHEVNKWIGDTLAGKHLTLIPSWIIRGVGGVTSDLHLTGLRPTENPLSHQGRSAKAANINEILIGH